MNCKNCGAPLNNGAKFCAGCGQTVRIADVPAMGYPQNPYAQNPAPQSQFSIPMPPPTSRYYPDQPQQSGGATGIKMLFVLFMIFSLLMASVGVIRFPIGASSEMDTIFECSNMTSITALWNINDGKIGDMIEYIVEECEDEPVFLIGLFTSVIAFFAAIIIGVVALIFCLAGSHSGAASMTGVGLIVLALGYLGGVLESIDFLKEMKEMSDDVKVRIGLMPPVMIAVCIAMGIFAFISAKKMKSMR